MPDDKPISDAKPDAASSAASDAAAQQDDKEVLDSSTKNGEKEKTLGEIVEEAAKASTAAQAVEEPPPGTKEEDAEDKVVEKEPDDKAEASKSDENADEALPFHKHPRFQEVIKERDTAKDEVEKLRPQAKNAEEIQSYCHKNSITAEEFNSALEIAALLHKDPKAARARLNEYVETIDVALGDRLPGDLQKKVDDGVVDLDSAKEIAQARMRSKNAEWSAKTAEQRLAETRAQGMTDAVNSWEASKRKTDPDYDKKYELLRDRFVFLRATQPPATSVEAVALAEQAYVYVNKTLSGFSPKPSTRKPLTTQGSSTKGEADFVMNDIDKDLPTLVNRVVAKHSRA